MRAIAPRQLAASLRAAEHIPHREPVAAFILDPATTLWPNPFAHTRVVTVRHLWSERAREYRLTGVEAIGIAELLAAIAHAPAETALVHEILRAGPITGHVFHPGDGCAIIGAVLHAKPNACLPALPKAPGRQTAKRSSDAVRQQLDLFDKSSYTS